jgi:hypothetical protein
MPENVSTRSGEMAIGGSGKQREDGACHDGEQVADQEAEAGTFQRRPDMRRIVGPVGPEAGEDSGWRRQRTAGDELESPEEFPGDKQNEPIA